MGIERRRDPRYFVRMRVAVVRGKRSEWFFTQNISYRGLFIRLPKPPKQRDVFDVRIQLPEGEHVELHATASHVVTPAQRPENPGVGVAFFGFGGVDAARWRQFVRGIRTSHPETLDPDTVLDLAPELAFEPHKRLGSEVGSRVRLRVQNADALYMLYTDNIRKGVLLLPTESELDPGTVLEVELVHPVTGARFPLAGVVRANIKRPTFQGIALALAHLTPRRTAELETFVNDDIHITVSA